MNKKYRFPFLFFFLADFASIVVSYYIIWFLRFNSEIGGNIFDFLNKLFAVDYAKPMSWELKTFYVISAPRIIIILTITLIFFYAIRNLYSVTRFILPRPVAWDITVSNIAALFIFYMYFYLSRNTFHPRSLFGSMLVINIFLTVIFRKWTKRLLAHFAMRGWGIISVLLMGQNRYCAEIEEILKAYCAEWHVTRRFVNDDSSEFIRFLKNEVARRQFDVLILASPNMELSELMEIVELTGEKDLELKILSNKMDVVVNEANLKSDFIAGMPLLHFCRPSDIERLQKVRHFIAFLFSAILFVLCIPFLCILAILIKLTSGGSVIYVQERIGFENKPFRMFKFRTMREGADEIQNEIEFLNESGAGLFKIRNDPRITSVGRFLRRFSFDELPQLINVLKGDMTLVGPRPLPRRDFENYYEKWHYKRHKCMPGLTCLWQVSGRSDLNFQNMCILDIYYLRNQGWVLDLLILWRTIWVVLFAKGAY